MSFRLVRQACRELYRKAYRCTPGGLGALHEGSEHFIIDILDGANLVCIHAGRVTIQAKDIQFVQRLIDVKKNYKTDEPMTGVGGLLKRQRIARQVATALQQQRHGTHGGQGETSGSLGQNDSDSDDDDDRRGRQSGNQANFKGGSSRKRRNEDNSDDENRGSKQAKNKGGSGSKRTSTDEDESDDDDRRKRKEKEKEDEEKESKRQKAERKVRKEAENKAAEEEL